MAGKKPRNPKNRKGVARSGKSTSRTATRLSHASRLTGRLSGRFSTTAAIIKELCRPGGASLAELAELSGWKPNSVRGFLHGPALKRRSLALRGNKDASGERRYFVDGGEGQ